MQRLVTRELERVFFVHLLDGVENERAPIERPFVYRFAFEDLGTHVDFAFGPGHVAATQSERTDATARLRSVSSERLLITLRHRVPDAADLDALGVVLEGDQALHPLVFALASTAPSCFTEALDAIDGDLARASQREIVRLAHRSEDDTIATVSGALRDARPTLVRGFPFPWAATTREGFLAAHGALETWTAGRFIPLEVYFDHSKDAPDEARSPVNHDAIYATNLVVPAPVVAAFGTPLFGARCGPPRLFGGRSALPDPTRWTGVTRPHRHAHDVVAWQVFGRKRWTLVPPAFRDHLVTRPMGFDTQFCGLLDPDSVEDAAFRSACTSFVMEPGEVLVLPGGWFHVTYVTGEPALGLSAFAKDAALRFVDGS